MNNKKYDFIWSYLSRGLNIGVGILVLPIILKKLSPEELGVWYIFLAISSLITLLDFGFLPTLQRNIGYIFKGADELQAEGVPTKFNSFINYQLLYDSIYASKKLYHKITIIIFILLNTLGSYYIYTIIKDLNNFKEIFIAWVLYLLSLCLNFYFYYYTALIKGKGLIGESEKITVISKLSFILICYILFFLNFGLITLSIANLISVFILRMCSQRIFYTSELKERLRDLKVKNQTLLKIMMVNAKKVGIVSIGGFLLSKGNTFVVSKYFSLELVGKYGLTMQIFSILLGVTATIYQVYAPEFYEYRLKNNLEKLKDKYVACYIVNLLLLVLGILGIIFILPLFLKLMGKNNSLLTHNQLLFLSLCFILESIHGNAAFILSTKNYIPYVKAGIFSGSGIIIISLLLIHFTNLGIWSVLISQFIVQLSYNNWKWPLEVNKELKINNIIIFEEGIKMIFNKLGGKNK